MDIMRVILILLSVAVVGNSAHTSLWQINSAHHANVRFGDLLISPRQQRKYAVAKQPLRSVSLKKRDDVRWENNIVPFVMSDEYNDLQKALIMDALLELQRRSCFKFVRRSTQADYVSIEPLDGCYSFVGRIGGRQLMSLAVDCLANYVIWHEMMHVIGFEHEHQRPDRDSYIHIQYHNIMAGQHANFHKLRRSEVDLDDDAYDYSSIMHYDGTAFGRFDHSTMRRLATMIPLKRGVTLTDNLDLSPSDIQKLNRLGNCTRPSDDASSESSCTDNASDCSVLVNRNLCNHSLYKDLMAESCAASCGFCAGRSRHSVEDAKQDDCSDEDPSCPIYARHGFCRDPFFASVRRQRCRMTCGLC